MDEITELRLTASGYHRSVVVTQSAERTAVHVGTLHQMRRLAADLADEHGLRETAPNVWRAPPTSQPAPWGVGPLTG